MLYTTELGRKWAFIWYFSGFSGASWFCKHFDSLLILSHFGGSSQNYHQFLSNVIPTLTWQNTNYSIIDDFSQWNSPHNHKLLLIASMHRYIRTAPASKHECPPPQVKIRHRCKTRMLQRTQKNTKWKPIFCWVPWYITLSLSMFYL